MSTKSHATRRANIARRRETKKRSLDRRAAKIAAGLYRCPCGEVAVEWYLGGPCCQSCKRIEQGNESAYTEEAREISEPCVELYRVILPARN